MRAITAAGVHPVGIRSARFPIVELARVGLTFLGLLLGLYYVALLGDGGRAVDGHTYFVARLDHLYTVAWPGTDAYSYPPAFRQALTPLVASGWTAYIVALRLLAVLAVVGLTGPLSPLVLVTWSVASEVNAANIHLLMAAAIVLGFRWPGTWAFILLTKVTPGVGLLWFAVRREWRSLGVALGVTATVVVASVLVAPGQWADWISQVAHATGADPGWTPIAAPLLARVAVASAIVIWGAARDQPWAVPIAATLALPAVWLPGMSVLVAAVPFVVWTPASRLLPAGMRPTAWAPRRAWAA